MSRLCLITMFAVFFVAMNMSILGTNAKKSCRNEGDTCDDKENKCCKKFSCENEKKPEDGGILAPVTGVVGGVTDTLGGLLGGEKEEPKKKCVPKKKN